MTEPLNWCYFGCTLGGGGVCGGGLLGQVEALILCDDGEPMFGEQKRCQKTIR